MAAINRLVGPVNVPGGTATLVYTVPSTGVSDVLLVSSTMINNRSDNNYCSYAIYVVPSGETLSVTVHTIVNERFLDQGDLPDVMKLAIPLFPGDKVYIKQNQGALTAILTGVVTPL